MTLFYIKKSDNLPAIRTSLTKHDGSPFAITTESIMFRMRPHDGPVGVYTVQGAAVVEDGPNGLISYTFDSVDTLTPGDYFAEWVVTGTGTVQTVPTATYDRIKVVATL